MCAIHHLIAALCMFYNIKNWYTIVNCDNQGAISMSERNLRRIQPDSSCADILRNLGNIKKQDERSNQVPACGRSHGQIPPLATAVVGAENECDVRHISKVGSVKSNQNKHEERRKAIAPQQRCSSVSQQHETDERLGKGSSM